MDVGNQPLQLLQAVQQDIWSLRFQLGFDRLSDAVCQAMLKVPRHEFVPEALLADAYRNLPLPIGLGQTISQPLIVALMTEVAAVSPGSRVLELGTGSGYQAAVLAALGAEVCSMEIHEPLAAAAKSRLIRLGFDAVQLRTGDACYGWPELAPFDAIVITAAGPSLPPALISQLCPGGRLVMPLGEPWQTQQLLVNTLLPDASFEERQLLPVRFVPITGGAA